MKLASLLFLVLLVYAHQVSDLYRPLEQPLSDFREGKFGLLGYALFCSIALICVLYTFGLNRFEEPGEATNPIGFGVLLLIVAATPCGWALHKASAIVLLASIYLYFSVELYRSGRPLLMLIHLSVPIVLAVVTRFQSYGLWQKALIVYFVVAATVHHDLVKRGARGRALAAP